MEIVEKKKVYPAKINGLSSYIKVKRDESGKVLQILEKPNLKQIPPGHYVGEHIVLNNPTENHYDHASGAIVREVWKEYPQRAGSNFNSKYWVSGNRWGVTDNWANPASFAIIVLPESESKNI